MLKVPVYDMDRLKRVLKRCFKERITMKYAKDALCTLEGTLDSQYYRITFDGMERYILLSTNEESRDVLEKFVPILSEVMGNHPPICRYDMVKKGDETDTPKPTLEWDAKDPTNRLRELLAGKGFVSYETKYLSPYVAPTEVEAQAASANQPKVNCKTKPQE